MSNDNYELEEQDHRELEELDLSGIDDFSFEEFDNLFDDSDRQIALQVSEHTIR